MEDRTTTFLGIEIIIIPIMIFIGIFGIMYHNIAGSTEYEKKYMAEDIQMFETQNSKYKDNTGSDSIQVVLEFDEDKSKEANIAVSNYLSNVNGKIISVNGQSTLSNTINPMIGGVYGPNGGGVAMGYSPGVESSNKTVYQILIPKGAKFSDNIQERIDRYLKYKHLNLFSSQIQQQKMITNNIALAIVTK